MVYKSDNRGVFKPRNPSKYRGDLHTITYRSWWEFKFMRRLDADSSVLSWSSEEIMIQYISPIDGKPHRYFPDFYVEKLLPNRTVKKFVIEIKPSAQCIKPVRRARQRQRTFIEECKTFETNKAKWRAATLFCQKYGYQFLVLTEKQMACFNKRGA